MEQQITPDSPGIEQEPIVSQPEMTPESAFEQTIDAQNNQQENTGLIDDFFRANKEAQEEPLNPEEPSPVNPQLEERTLMEGPQQEAAEPIDVDNDVKRYQYWQSEADKARNENKELVSRLEKLESQAPAEQPQKEEEPKMEFPPPPEKPQKPPSYSRSDAYEDPSSDSAQYLDAMDGWRDNMDEYNRLYNQYTQAVVEEERQKMNQEREDIQRKQADREAYDSNMRRISQHLAESYQASPDEINKFIEVMDDPNNITVDNLFQLYRLQNGGNLTPVNPPLTETPQSDSFEQRKRAQSVPSPMGVVPAQTKSPDSNSENSIVDSMISDYNKRNPWNT
jgi:hypothetical protein|tara:strand:+ start:2151 stop:3161 length:1011 start_codon:yes stop_codon:yes gene_type:complete